MTVAAERAALHEFVAAAHRDLADVETAVAGGEGEWDSLVALVLLARLTRRADDATFALLDARAAARPRTYTLSGYKAPTRQEGEQG